MQYINKRRYSIITFIMIMTIGLFIGCEKETEKIRGDIVSSTSVLTYTPADLEILINNGDLDAELEYSVETIKIVYYTLDQHGKSVKASGALMVPQSAQENPLLCLNHGTETKRTMVASVSPLYSVEGVMGLILGSRGYLACVPDYLGFGVSNQIHPYCHAKSNAVAVIDFIRAAYSYCEDNNITLNGQLFLTGY